MLYQKIQGALQKLRLKKNGYNILKIFHIIFASNWLTSAISFTYLLLIINAENVSGILNTIHLVDMAITIPSGILCFVTGMLFSLFTNWGFIKHRWVVVKYGITVISCCAGPIMLSPSLNKMLGLIETLENNALFDTVFIQSYTTFLIFNILNVVLFLFAFVISVIKPKFGKRSAQKIINGN
jgi:hypothetical protein